MLELMLQSDLEDFILFFSPIYNVHILYMYIV